jgi:hypothetical protein
VRLSIAKALDEGEQRSNRCSQLRAVPRARPPRPVGKT